MAEASLTEGVWTQLTSVDAANFTLQNHGPSGIEVKRSVAAPADLSNAIRFEKGEGASEKVIAEFFMGGAGARLWAFATEGRARVSFYES